MSWVHSFIKSLQSVFLNLWWNFFSWHHANIRYDSKVMIWWRTTTMESSTIEQHKITSFSVYFDVITKRLFVSVLFLNPSSLWDSLHVSLLEILFEIKVRFWNTYKSSSMSSCISQCHNSLITPDSFLYWWLVNMKTLIFRLEREVLNTIRKGHSIEWTL